jgi:hypothetical protein
MNDDESERILIGSGRGLILRYYPDIRLEVPRKSTKNFSQGSWSSGRDSNPGPPEYEAGLLISQPRCVCVCKWISVYACVLQRDKEKRLID